MRQETPSAVRQPPITLRITEACRTTGIGRSKFYELIKTGDIETIKIGRITLVPMTSIERLIDRCRSRASPEQATGQQRISMHPFVANAVVTAALAAMSEQVRSSLVSVDELTRSKTEDDLAARIVEALQEVD